MALHTDLQIHRTAYQLFGVIIRLVKNIPRDYKALIGYKLRDDCLAVCQMIARANRAETKAAYLEQLIEYLQQIELLLRQSADLRLISIGQYSAAIELSTSVGKQASGWRRSEIRPLHEGQGRHD